MPKFFKIEKCIIRNNFFRMTNFFKNHNNDSKYETNYFYKIKNGSNRPNFQVK
jgi:hypothetical protein